jgi:hypothetical protein
MGSFLPLPRVRGLNRSTVGSHRRLDAMACEEELGVAKFSVAPAVPAFDGMLRA